MRAPNHRVPRHHVPLVELQRVGHVAVVGAEIAPAPQCPVAAGTFQHVGNLGLQRVHLESQLVEHVDERHLAVVEPFGTRHRLLYALEYGQSLFPVRKAHYHQYPFEQEVAEAVAGLVCSRNPVCLQVDVGHLFDRVRSLGAGIAGIQEGVRRHCRDVLPVPAAAAVGGGWHEGVVPEGGVFGEIVHICRLERNLPPEYPGKERHQYANQRIVEGEMAEDTADLVQQRRHANAVFGLSGKQKVDDEQHVQANAGFEEAHGAVPAAGGDH